VGVNGSRRRVELAAEKGAEATFMPVSSRQRYDLSDDVATNVTVHDYADVRKVLAKVPSDESGCSGGFAWSWSRTALAQPRSRRPMAGLIRRADSATR
jgi:hypothetical protein